MISYRARRLVEKLLSFKFVIFVIATALRCADVIGAAEWITVATLVIAGHEGQKGFNRFMDKISDEEIHGAG